MSDTSTSAVRLHDRPPVRLPLAELPATVLPGAVITLALVTDRPARGQGRQVQR